MAIRRIEVVGLFGFLALAIGLASPAQATEYKAKATLGRAHVKIEFEIEKKGTVRELQVKDAEHIALPDGTYTLTVQIDGNTVLTQTVTLRRGDFKKIKIRQVNTGNLFSVAVPPTSTVVSLVGAGGTVVFPTATFRKD